MASGSWRTLGTSSTTRRMSRNGEGSGERGIFAQSDETRRQWPPYSTSINRSSRGPFPASSGARTSCTCTWSTREPRDRKRDGSGYSTARKPTNPYPRSLQVPERIRSHEEILEFLEQFPPIDKESEALRFFGLTSEWAEEHAGELFWWLLGFLVGDMGKRYVHNEHRSRHYRKSAMNTRMANTGSNLRVLRYV